MTLPPFVGLGESTEVVTGVISAPGGHVVNTARGPTVDDDDDDVVEDGWKVNVSPSVVTVVGAVRPVGTVNVLDPTMIIPELEIIVCPSPRVVVRTAGELIKGGERVKVAPSVTSVVGEVTVGSVMVLLPIMTMPELEVSVWPSGSVEIKTGCELILEGDSVKVSPSVTSVVGEVTNGSVIV